MAKWKKLQGPSTTTSLFILLFLFAFLGERTCGDFVSQGSIKGLGRKDGRGSNLQVDVVATTVAADGSDKVLSAHTHGIRFEPPSLDFQEQSVGMPRMESIRVHNPSQSQSLHLNSISGDSPVFHAAFFKSKVLKAGESTTFDVIFLARGVESVQTTLYIQTSLGTFDYRVQGIGVPNRFRLRSLLGARIPVNATYSPLISMYNPFNTSLQVTEMYSSGGELHLELLTGQPHGTKSLWEIRPYETKTIGRANFFGRLATNHTSFIRIKTNHTSSPSIVLPVEVEVLDSSSLFLSREILDFGILKSGESKSLPLYVLNTGAHQVHIKSITSEAENRALEVEYTSIILKPGSKYTKIAMITFHSDRVSVPKQSSGVLVIRADGRTAYQLEVPFEANVLHGSLSYEKSKTLFKVGRPPFHPVVHQIPLANRFKVPVVIYDVKLPSKAQEYFTIQSFVGPFVLPPDSEWYYPFSIQFLPSSSDCLFNTTLRLSTNSTYFTIPLHCYDGRVKYSVEGPSEEEDTLDYGILSESDSSSKTFTVHNLNPVEILISSFTVSTGLPFTTVELVSIHPTNQSSPSSRAPSPPPTPPHFVEVGHSASFRVNVTRPSAKGTYSGEILVHTSYNNVLHVPVYYKTIVGGLKVLPEFIDFAPTFPYGVATVPVYMSNLYQQPMTVTSVQREPTDDRFDFQFSDRETPQLLPREKVQIGTAVFDPLHESEGESVYLGIGSHHDSSWHDHASASSATPTAASKPAGSTVRVGGVKLSNPLRDIDYFSSLWKNWTAVVEGGANVLNFSYVVKVDVGPELSVPGRATLVWPHLLDSTLRDGNLVEFPTTTIGSSYLQVLNVTNPSHHPLLIQPVLLQHFTHTSSIVDMLTDQLDPDLGQFDFSSVHSDSFTFSQEHVLFDTESSLRDTVLQPSDQYQITVAFSPKVDSLASTLLLIRNNLTVFDYMVLRGRGVQGVFSIDGIQPSSDPLLFEFTQTMMEKCYAGIQRDPMKISRVFSMHNSGATPLTLYLAGVGAGGKEEGGFSVHNYHREIIIKPNKTKSIEISFVPDFTISRVSNTLRFKTSAGTELLFPLLAILPHNLLAVCYAMQPRPEWERTIAWISVPFWLCALVTLVAVVLVQTNFGFSPPLTYDNDSALPATQATGGQVFDLKSVNSASYREDRTNSSVPAKANSKSPETLGSVSVSVHTRPSPSLLPHEESQHRVVPGKNPTRPAPAVSELKTRHVTEEQGSTERAGVGSGKEHCEREAEASRGTNSTLHQQATGEKGASFAKYTSPSSSSIQTHTPGQHRTSDCSQPVPSHGSGGEAPPRIVPVAEIKPSPHISQSISRVSILGQQSHSAPSPAPSSSSSSSSKPSKLADIDTRSNPQATPPHMAGTENTSPTTGVASAPPSSLPDPTPTSATTTTTTTHQSTKRVKRKSGSKAPKMGVAEQSSNVAAVPATGTHTLPASSPTVAPPTSAALVREHMQRKESESSLRSTDSSESTGSSMDKSEEREDTENVIPTPPIPGPSGAPKETVVVDSGSVEGGMALSKSKLHPLPLAKEPGTGQTVHVPETATMSPPPAEQTTNEDEAKKEVGVAKAKSKRKLRQLKKEEKSRKKEREKLSRAKEKAEKGRGVTDEPSPSPEEEVSSTGSAAAAKATKPKTPLSPTKPERGKQHKTSSTKRVESVDSGSYGVEDTISSERSGAADSTTVERAMTSTPPLPATTTTSSATSTSSSNKPSSAIKSTRGQVAVGVGSVPAKLQEDHISDPFSRNPDRSTYARKKLGSKKSTEKLPSAKSPAAGTENHVTSGCGGKPAEPEAEGMFEVSQELASDESLGGGDEADSSSVSPEAVEDSTELDSQGGGGDRQQHKDQQMSAAGNIVSPHDLAASLLSKMKTKKHWPPKSGGGGGGGGDSMEEEEEELTSVKQDGGSSSSGSSSTSSSGANASDGVAAEKVVRPSTLSPLQDGSVSSPSPPLSGEQYKTSSSLSLDAEPFYPSSNYKTKKHSKSGSQGRKGKGGDRKTSVEPKDVMSVREGGGGGGGGRGKPHPPQRGGRTPTEGGGEGVPPGMSPMSAEKAEFYHHHRHQPHPPPPPPAAPPLPPPSSSSLPDKPSTPSPPFPYGDPHAYRYGADMPYDMQEPLGGEYRRPPPMDRDVPGSHFSPVMDDAMMLGLHERGGGGGGGVSERPSRHDLGGMDPSYFASRTGRPPPLPPPPPPHHHHPHHHMGAGHRMGGSMYPHHKYQQMGGGRGGGGYPQPPPGYGHPADVRSPQFDDDFRHQQYIRKRQLLLDLVRQERATLAAIYAREQARKSAEAFSSLQRSSSARGGGSGGMGMGLHAQKSGPIGKHLPHMTGSPVDIWDDYPPDAMPPPHPPLPHPHGRGFDDPSPLTDPDLPHHPHHRLPYMVSDPLQPTSSSHLPSRTRNLSEASDIGGEILSGYSPPEVQSAGTPVGPPGYKRAPGARLEQQEQEVGAELRVKESPLAWPPEGEDAPAGSDWDADNWMMDPSLTSRTSDTGVSNTYALFENQSIWSLNSSGSESSNLLSWAMLGAEQQQQQQQEKNTDQ